MDFQHLSKLLLLTHTNIKKEVYNKSAVTHELQRKEKKKIGMYCQEKYYMGFIITGLAMDVKQQQNTICIIVLLLIRI